MFFASARPLRAAYLAAAFSLVASRASAQEAVNAGSGSSGVNAPASPSEDRRRLAVLDYELAMYAREGFRERLSRSLTGGLLGAAVLPAGLVLHKRHDDLLQLTGVALIASGAVQLSMFLGILRESDLERVAKHHAQRKASGLAPAEVVRQTEAEWQHEAEVESKAWRWTGSIQLAIGTAALPAGLAFLLKDQLGSMPHKRQVNVGATLVGLGVPYVMLGVHMLCTTNPTMASWRASQGARESWRLAAANSLSVTPTRDGAVFGASARF